jgi:hypothetical protein
LCIKLLLVKELYYDVRPTKSQDSNTYYEFLLFLKYIFLFLSLYFYSAWYVDKCTSKIVHKCIIYSFVKYSLYFISCWSPRKPNFADLLAPFVRIFDQHALSTGPTTIKFWWFLRNRWQWKWAHTHVIYARYALSVDILVSEIVKQDGPKAPMFCMADSFVN